jgi:glycosyltransferase involved in cell wall biosynthesis
MKKISVIVPVYNVEKYISKCLDSLVNQTLDDIEIIVVNDGSKDNSEKIIDKYVKKYPNMIFSYKKENGGLSSARNYGLKLAKGEYIAFIDSDDYVDLDLFEKMYNTALNEKSDVVVCPVKYVYKDKISHKNFNMLLFNKSIKVSPKILIEAKSYAPNKIYKREFWMKNKFEFPNQYFEDSALIYNVLLKANKVSAINDGYYFYNRINDSSITKVLDNRIYDIFKSTDSILSFYKKNKVYEKIKDSVDYVIIGHIRFRTRTYISAHAPKQLKEFINYSHKYLDEKIPDWRNNDTNKLKYNKSRKDKLYCIIFKNNVSLNVYIIMQKIKHLFKKR